MAGISMTSRWGVQLEGEAFDLANTYNKLTHSITSEDSFFFTMIDTVHVLRTRTWDSAATSTDAFELAVGDINLIRGCLDAIDGCQAIQLGTIYNFHADGRYDMSRRTSISIGARKRIEDLASPVHFRDLLAKAASDRNLRTAFADLTPDTPWIDIYRCWESLKDYFGGEHKVHRAFKSEEARIKQLTRTANSFRHVRTYDVPKNAMPHAEAVLYLKDLLIRAAAQRGLPPANKPFPPGQSLHMTYYELEPGQPASLNRLSLSPSESNTGP